MAMSQGSEERKEARFNPIRARALLLGFFLTIPVTYAVTNQSFSSIFSLMVPPVSALLFLVLLNVLLRKVLPRLALSQADFIVVFAIVSVAGSIAGEWSTVTFPSTYSYPLVGKTNDTVKNQLAKHVPDWLAVKDLATVQDVQGGGKDFPYVLGKVPAFFHTWLGWAWTMLSLCVGMLCINSLMRGAWCERERLTFPLIQLPVAMSEDGGRGGMWRSRHMWIALAVMFSIDMLNGLNYLYPNLPSIPVKDLFYIDRALKDPPWSNIGDFRIAIYPFMAAIGLFMPSDMLLSFVVFFLLRKATHVALASQGIPQSTFSGTGISPGPPYFDEQTWGAVIALFLGTWWVSKDYLKGVWRDIRSNAKPADGGIRHRWAFFGLIVTFFSMIAYGMIGGGLPFAYMVPYLVLFLMFSIVTTRVRAQLGPPTHEFAFFGPSSIMHRFLGNKWLDERQASFVAQAMIHMNRIYRNHPMPYQLEAMKMGQAERLKQSKVFWIVVAATVVGFFLGYLFLLTAAYRTGSTGWVDAPTYLNNILNNRKGPDVVGITMTIFGFAVVMVLDLVRFKFPGFPLHPAGYFLSMNYGVDYYWFGLLVALFVKNFVQRYYGLRGYDKLRMVALGILVGEYAAETIWMGIALITKQSTYTISFNDRSLLIQ